MNCSGRTREGELSKSHSLSLTGCLKLRVLHWWIETLLMRMYCEHEEQKKIENQRPQVMLTGIAYKIMLFFTETSWNKMTHGRQQIGIFQKWRALFMVFQEHYKCYKLFLKIGQWKTYNVLKYSREPT